MRELCAKVWFWLFAGRRRWVAISPDGGKVRFTLAGFDLTPADVREYHGKVTALVLGMGGRFVCWPAEVDPPAEGQPS